MTIKFIQEIYLWLRESTRYYTKMFKKKITLWKKFFFTELWRFLEVWIFINENYCSVSSLNSVEVPLIYSNQSDFSSTKACSQLKYTTQALSLAHTNTLLEIMCRCCGALRKPTSGTPLSMNGVSTQPTHCFNNLRQKYTQSYYVQSYRYMHHSHTFSTLRLCLSCW